MLPKEIINEMLMKLKFEHGIVLTKLDVDWQTINIASADSAKEYEYFNPQVSMTSILDDGE